MSGIIPPQLFWVYIVIKGGQFANLNIIRLMKAFDAKPNKMLEAVFNKTLNIGDLDNNGEITFDEFEEFMKNAIK